MNTRPNPERRNLTPGQAIRQFCLECTGGKPCEVRRCTAQPDVCRFHPNRMGRGCDRSRDPNPPTRLKAIRQECLHCMGGSRKLVKECRNENCPSWRSHMRTRPRRQIYRMIEKGPRSIENRRSPLE